jgi:ABC-2 type transport system ATP-binding protein
MAAEDTAVRAVGIHKRYRRTEALRGVDLTVEKGTVCGLLGPNGAGKTTMVRILTTLLRPDAGEATVAGCDVLRQAAQVRYRIGLAGQYAAVDELLTGKANLEMVGRLYHLPVRQAKARAAELLERFDLADAANRVAKTYSGGMRRRLDVAAALVAAPPVLFLDEPTTGLDPRSRNDVWQVISELVAEGTTVLLTTQYLEEADRLANKIVVIDHGKVVAEGTAASLKSKVGGERIDVVVTELDQLGATATALRAAVGSDPSVEPDDRRVTVAAPEGAASLTAVVRELDAAGIAVADIGLRRPTLDDVFLRLTGRRAEDAGDSTELEEVAR